MEYPRSPQRRLVPPDSPAAATFLTAQYDAKIRDVHIYGHAEIGKEWMK
jgi:hypothetical protein